MDLHLVTCTELPEPDHDEQPLLDALGSAGVAAQMVAWNDPTVDWSQAPLTVMRSAWDYADDRDGFLAWARRVAASRTVLRNPLSTIVANTHKSYLAALDRAGLPVVPTRWFAHGGRPATVDALRALPWERIVAKPAVGAGSRGVRAFELADDDELETAAAHVLALQQQGEVLVQPQLQSIMREGERDVVWVDGACTHTVTKLSRLAGESERAPDCRVPTEAERQLVDRVLRTIPAWQTRELLYARVDVAPDELGDLRIIELELVEPSLFVAMHPPAMDRLVQALARNSGC